MTTVGVMIQNSKYGLHDGHRALIEFAKQFGDVHVELLENMRDRNNYLLHGRGTPKYKMDIDKIQNDCKELNVKLDKPIYVNYTDEERATYYNAAQETTRLIEEVSPNAFLSERFRTQFICSMMYGPSRKKHGIGYDVQVFGPDVASYVNYSIITSLRSGRIQVIEGVHKVGNIAELLSKYNKTEKIVLFDKIIKDAYGLKLSTSAPATTFDKASLARVINETRKDYQIGRNDALVESLNNIYPPECGWRWYEILVYPRENGHVLEVTAVSQRTDEGLVIFDNIDYR